MIGSKIVRYEITEKLGEGGMGVVYRASDTKLIHPAIAGIHGVEESNGQFAIVMELAEGPTLADRLSSGPISMEEALPIAKQIAEALEAAHEKGFVH